MLNAVFWFEFTAYLPRFSIFSPVYFPVCFPCVLWLFVYSQCVLHSFSFVFSANNRSRAVPFLSFPFFVVHTCVQCSVVVLLCVLYVVCLCRCLLVLCVLCTDSQTAQTQQHRQTQTNKHRQHRQTTTTDNKQINNKSKQQNGARAKRHQIAE